MATEAATPGAGQGAFLRKSSGLVRSFSPTDTLWYNILANNPFAVAAIGFSAIAIAYPQANIWLAVVVCGFFCVFEAISYAFLVSTMPRSGGDYIFQSRIFNGPIATIFAVPAVAGNSVLVTVIYGSTLSVLLLSPFLTLLGVFYHVHGLVTVGTWFGTTTGIFVACLIFAAWSTLINLFGLKVYAAVQRWTFLLGLGGLTIVFAVMLFTSHQTFVNNFNHFMATHFKTSNAYHQILHSAGPIKTSSTLHFTLLAVPLVAFSLIFPAWSAMQSGEIKRAGTVKWNVYAIVGAEVASVIIGAVGAALLVSRVGGTFFSAAGTLSASSPAKYPIPTSPYFTFFASMMSTSPILTWIMCITAFGWICMWLPNGTLATTRLFLAMSLDGLLPEWWGKVNRRTHTPNNAIFALAFSYVVIAFLYLAYPHLTAYLVGITLLSITGFAVSNLAGAVMPWKNRALYDSAPAGVRTRIGPIPLITISGVIFALFAAALDYLALTQAPLGVNTTQGLIVVAIVYAICILIYAVAWYVRRRRGYLDLNLTYKELPVE